MRTATGGESWSQRVRITKARNVLQAVVAARGRNVYVAWVGREAHTNRLHVRVNHGYGRADAWSRARGFGRVSQTMASNSWVSVAATGSTVFLVARVQRFISLWTSFDGGSRWSSRHLTTATPMGDRKLVDAHGPLVAVALSTAPGFVTPVGQMTIARDGGRHWSRPRAVGAGLITSLAVRNGRVVIVGGYPFSYSWVRTWEDGAWGPRVSSSALGMNATLLVQLNRRAVGIAEIAGLTQSAATTRGACAVA